MNQTTWTNTAEAGDGCTGHPTTMKTDGLPETVPTTSRCPHCGRCPYCGGGHYVPWQQQTWPHPWLDIIYY